jgi:hypothetical protein
MKAEVISSRILHCVYFAPNPNNGSFPTTPKVIDTRFVRDILEFPKGVKYVSFHDVVETKVQINGQTKKVYSEPFNRSEVHFVLNNEERSMDEWTRGYHEIEVHPSLKGKIRVFGSLSQFEDQKAT